ncbi:MAG: hypothetical protein NT169_21130 [Chloroflexi bacterium]|nr:hypothetical protein [Chloroflexota bacterium]
MDQEEFKARTRQLALRVVKLAQALPNDPVARTIGPPDILERVDPIFYSEPLAAALKALGIG